MTHNAKSNFRNSELSYKKMFFPSSFSPFIISSPIKLNFNVFFLFSNIFHATQSSHNINNRQIFLKQCHNIQYILYVSSFPFLWFQKSRKSKEKRGLFPSENLNEKYTFSNKVVDQKKGEKLCGHKFSSIKEFALKCWTSLFGQLNMKYPFVFQLPKNGWEKKESHGRP